KTVSFGGMITEEDHRTSAKGKAWGMFTIEGYDESYQLRLFNDDYLKNRHLLFKNNFVYVKAIVREGWPDKRTGQPGEPKLQIVDNKTLHEGMENYAKQLMMRLHIREIDAGQLEKTNPLHEHKKGKRKIVFEIAELDPDRTITPTIPEIPDDMIDSSENEEGMVGEPAVEYKVKNKIVMPSRNTPVDITKDLLEELEQLGVTFEIN